MQEFRPQAVIECITRQPYEYLVPVIFTQQVSLDGVV